jgi:hypothetical protein
MGMRAHAISPEPALRGILEGSQFIDAFSVVSPGPRLDAREAAERALGRSPAWATALLALRDAIVSPLGLKTAHALSDQARIGIFPIVSETPERVVVGFDDDHLDFRVFIDVAPADSGQRVTATTVVRTHNRLGRAYLAMVLPFHRLIVRAMLDQVRA